MDFSALTVLVVDDDSDNIETLSSVLGEFGLTVCQAHCSEDAISILEKENFDIVLSDIYMPNKSGYSVLSTAKMRGTPIILAMSGQNVQWEAKNHGATDFIHKPIRPNGLKRVIRVALENDFKKAV